MKYFVIAIIILLIFSITGCSQPEHQTTDKMGVVDIQDDVAEMPIKEPVIVEDPKAPADIATKDPENIKDIEPPVIEDYCEGSPADDNIVCRDDDGDDQISIDAIETLGEVKDSRKTKFFDKNSFYLKVGDQEYKLTVRQDASKFYLDAIPKEEVGLCGLDIDFMDNKYTIKFNPGSSHKKWSDVEHCLDDCGVEQDSSEQPDFDQQGCLLDCGIQVCSS